MRAIGQSLDAGLLTVFQSGAVVGTGGSIDTPNQRSGSITYCRSLSTEEPRPSAWWSGTDGTQVRLGDVADIVTTTSC